MVKHMTRKVIPFSLAALTQGHRREERNPSYDHHGDSMFVEGPDHAA
jgi:hypothetical protein